MNILYDLNEGINLGRLKNVSADKVKNAFFSNYLVALIMLKIQDLQGLSLINDHAHLKLNKFSGNMSDINFWARALFHSNEPDVKNRLLRGHGDLLAVESGRVSSQRIEKIVKVPITPPAHVDWKDTILALFLLKHRFDIKSSYFNSVSRALHKWESISNSSRQKAVNDSFMYLMQSDPQSALLPKIRQLSNGVMINAVDSLAKKIVGFARIQEDDGAASSVGNVATGDGTASNNSIINFDANQKTSDNDLGGLFRLQTLAKHQVTKKSKFTIKNGKLVKKRAKNFSPKKFVAPEFLKPVKKEKDNEPS